MYKLLVWTVLLCAACQAPPPTPDLRSTRSTAITTPDSGAGSADDCDCPPGSERRTNDEGQVTCWVPQCTGAKPCGPREACVAGMCELEPCVTDASCDGALVCVDGACVQPACDQCPSGYTCVLGQFPEGDHRCVPDHCNTDAECPSRMRCVEHACAADPAFCDEDGDCASGHCRIPPPPPDCGDCEAFGLCVPIGGCASDQDCPQGQRCDQAVCTTRPPPCTRDADCPGGKCNVASGVCVGADECVEDQECPAGQQCRIGVCGFPEMCNGDEDCGDGLRCIAGACTECSADIPGCAPPAPDPDPPVDAGVPDAPPPPDAGIPPIPPPPGPPGPPQGPYGCPTGCNGQLRHQLLCPIPPIQVRASNCPPSNRCGALDACRNAELAACDWCPVACVAIPNGVVQCCDCGGPQASPAPSPLVLFPDLPSSEIEVLP